MVARLTRLACLAAVVILSCLAGAALAANPDGPPSLTASLGTGFGKSDLLYQLSGAPKVNYDGVSAGGFAPRLDFMAPAAENVTVIAGAAYEFTWSEEREPAFLGTQAANLTTSGHVIHLQLGFRFYFAGQGLGNSEPSPESKDKGWWRKPTKPVSDK